jgi:predicted nucleotidyltransferase component of viral defense system
MNKQLATSLQAKMRISVDKIVREEYEMILLKSLFHGGTALRLAYGSPRFSDDLDFCTVEKVEKETFASWCQEVAKANPNVTITDCRKKFYTLFGLFKIVDPTLSQAFSIRVEISTRENGWTKGKTFDLINIGSQATPITVTAQVATLQKIESEKRSIRPLRIRDVFDLWFIGQKLGRSTKMDFRGFKHQEVLTELHKYLSQSDWRLIEPWLPKKSTK